MKTNYYKNTDSLYIDVPPKPNADSREVSEGIILDYDANGNIIGIELNVIVLLPDSSIIPFYL